MKNLKNFLNKFFFDFSNFNLNLNYICLTVRIAKHNKNMNNKTKNGKKAEN